MQPQWFVFGLSLFALGCKVHPVPSGAPQAAEALGEARCGVIKSSSKPLVVEWPATERAALEARAGRGLVAVRYVGCEMEVLSQCEAPGEYEYLGLTTKRETIRIRNADDLYARLPVGAASLEGHLRRTGQLNVDLMVVGRKEAGVHALARAALEGGCEGATHFVSGLTVGAFSLYTGDGIGGGASATVGGVGAGVGAGGERSIARETLREDGDPGACEGASGADQAPPMGCAALLRVEVVPLSEHSVAGTGGGSASSPPTSPLPEFRTICDAIDLEVVKIGRRPAEPPFRDRPMDVVTLRIHNRNDEPIELDSGSRASFLDAQRAMLDAETPTEWHIRLELPSRSSRLVEVLLPHDAGKALHSIELQAQPQPPGWGKCRVVDDQLAPAPPAEDPADTDAGDDVG